MAHSDYGPPSNRERTEQRVPMTDLAFLTPWVPCVLDASRLDQARPRPRDGTVLVRVDVEDEGRGIPVFPGPEVVVVPWSKVGRMRTLTVGKGIDPNL